MNTHPEKYLVFTYGTLKRSFPNYGVMETINASFIAVAKTKYRYPMLQMGKWKAPFLFFQENYPKSYKVEGELFEVDRKGILALDEFEGVDQSYYKRLEIEIDCETDKKTGVTKKAWCYFSYKNSADLLRDSSKFISFFGKEALKKYTPVNRRPADWKENL